MRKSIEVYKVIHLPEDSKANEIVDSVNHIMWLTGQPTPTIIVQMTCELIRQLMMNQER